MAEGTSPPEEKKKKALRTIDVVRPYARAGFAGGATGLWTGLNINRLRREAPVPPKKLFGTAPAPKMRRGWPIALAILGAALGISDARLLQLARQAKYRSTLPETHREAV
jgi:hypothetical protein